MTKLIDGKRLAKEITTEIKYDLKTIKLKPTLAVILVGEDEPSKLFIKIKERECKKVGIDFKQHNFPEDSKQKDIINLIKKLNKDKKTNAILIQLPLPKKFNTDKIIKTIDPIKDVDGFHPKNIKSYLKNKTDYIPGLTQGIIKLINSTPVNLSNKKTVIVSNSKIFAKPLKHALKKQGAKVKWKKGNKIKDLTKFDIIIVAIGKPNYIKKEMIKSNCIIIDVGITKTNDNKTVGDVDFEDVKNKVDYITPVPGGVGPITIAMLLKNVVYLMKEQQL